jgi:aminopeptidase N
MPSLTVAEAQERAALLTVEGYAVDLDLTVGDEVFASRTTIALRCAEPGAGTFLDVQPHRLLSVTLNGEHLDAGSLVDGRLPLTGLAADNEIVVDAEMAYSHDGEGLHRSVDPADGSTYLYAMSFLDAAPRIFGCFDQPDLKAPYAFTVTAPPDWTVLGNGAATRTEPGRWRLATTKPLSTYFVTLVAGPYHSVRAEHDGIPLGLHVSQSLAQHLDRDAEEILRVTGQALDEYHRLFGIRYAFGEYHQAFVPEFNAGAMENPGCVTFRDQLIFRGPVTDGERSNRARTIVHEMAHQWFGDLVTMRWWDDLWLNESFAEYMAYRVCEAATDVADSWADFAFVRKRWGMDADQRPSTHPVAGNGAADAASALNDFDGISYAKGAAALKQLNAYLGDDVFLDGVRRHLHEHSLGNATLADLLAAWASAGAVDLEGWAGQWLRRPGIDTIEAVRTDGATELRRTPPASFPAQRLHAFTVAAYGVTGAGPQCAVQLSDDRMTIGLNADEVFPVLVPDAYDDTWAKVRLDPSSMAALPAVLPRIDNVVTRAVVWNAVRSAVDDAQLSPLTMLDVLEAALPDETEDVALTSLLDWTVRSLRGRYLGLHQAGQRVADLATTCLAGAGPGSSIQLAAARAVAGSGTDADLLRSWLEGAAAPDGLVLDLDLQWALLARLCVLGAAGSDAIEQQLRTDRSTKGSVHAARCRASLPDEDAKATAWRLISEDPAVSNYELYATCQGFWHPEHDAVTTAFVPRYFSEVPVTTRFRSGWVVGESARRAFPAYAVSPATLHLAHAALAEPIDSGVARSIADGADDLRRAVTVRAAFAG